MLPCRLVNRHNLRYDVNHPASNKDLMKAAGVEAGSHWCPYFDPTAFRKVDQRVARDVEQSQRRLRGG